MQQVNCSKCSYATAIDATLLPTGGMEGICPCCRSSIPLGGWGAPLAEETSSSVEVPLSVPTQVTSDTIDDQEIPEGKVSLITIIALLFIVDSTLSLISRMPNLAGILGGGTGLSFHQQAKYLYDTLMAAGFFIAAFGLMARKPWARIASIWLLGLGLAEGLYLMAYQYVAITELERNVKDTFPELKRHQNAKMIGCAVYAFFIVKLNSRAIKARFR